MRNEGKRRETSALDKDECKMPVGFPGELIGKQRYLSRVMGYESSTDSRGLKPDYLQRICIVSKEEDIRQTLEGPRHRREEQGKRNL